MPARSDLALVEAAMEGDVESFTKLCRRYYPAMVAIAHSITGERHVAEDAAQQAFAKAVRKLPQLRDKGKFGGWLAVICRNAARDMARDRKRHSSSEGLSLIAAEPREDGLVDTVKEAISELSVSAREVIFLRYYDGMTYERMSSVLGISEQAINGRLRRARKKIADYLGRNGLGGVRL